MIARWLKDSWWLLALWSAPWIVIMVLGALGLLPPPHEDHFPPGCYFDPSCPRKSPP